MNHDKRKIVRKARCRLTASFLEKSTYNTLIPISSHPYRGFGKVKTEYHNKDSDHQVGP
jgi:hypothetical protein